MAIRDLLPEIEKIILPFLEREGVELVEISPHGKGRTSVLRITIWEKGGIGTDELSRLSRHISDLLDEEDIIPGKYTLEVSSPGLDRELKTENDFRRAEGEKVKLTLSDGSTMTGEIASAADGQIILIEEEEQKPVPIGNISRGKIIIEF